MLKDTKIIDSNPKAWELFEKSGDELLGYSVLDCCTPYRGLSKEEIQEKIEKVAMGNPQFFEWIHKKKDGSLFCLEVNCTKMSLDDEEVILSVWHDITERKRAERALRESESALQSIFRSVPVGIGMVRNRTFLQMNDRFCQILRYHPDELLNKSIRMLYETQEEFDYVGRELYRQLYKDGVGTLEANLRRKDGKLINVLLTASLLDVHDPSKGISFALVDITGIGKV